MKHFKNIVNLLFLLLLWLSISCVASAPISLSPECSGTCGNVNVSYPFGIGQGHCAINADFLLQCNDSDASLILGKNLAVSNISLEDGSLSVLVPAAYYCYDINGQLSSVDQFISLGNTTGPFTFSASWNKFTAIGCDTLAIISDANENFGTACASYCVSRPTNTTECSGVGCCQTPFPQNYKTFNITVMSTNNHSQFLDFNRCGYAFLADQRKFDAADYGLEYKDLWPEAAIEWVVGEKTCAEAQSDNSTYACVIRKMVMGIDARAKKDSEETLISTVNVDAMVIIGLLIFVILKRRRKENNFLQNGGLLLKHQRVRIFSEAELAKATKNYDKGQFLGEGGFGTVYRGILENNIQVAVKKPKVVEDKSGINHESQQEIAIVSQVNHINVVKIVGLCIETAIPLLVYELISNGTLSQHIHGKKSNILQTWKARLRVASETALALDYLHSLADPPIIHSDIKSANILLDDNYTAKVADFGASVLMSADETIMATKIQGTRGYLDPEYLMTGILTTKSDVYSFGILLVELLTGVNPCSPSRSKEIGNIVHYFQSSLKSNNLFSILDFQIIDNDEREEIKVVAALAKTCIDISGIRRPTMKEVAEELVGLRKLRKDIAMQQNSDETEYLLCESSSNSSNELASANMKRREDTHTTSTLDIESCGCNI